MHREDRSFYIVSGITAAICAAVIIASFYTIKPIEERSLTPHLVSVLELDALADTTSSLVVGYNYYLLERYAQSDERTIDISIREKNASYLDSLRRGVIDILVVPFEHGLQLDSLIASSPIDSLSIWIMREDEEHEMENLNKWIDLWRSREENDAVRESFMSRYNVFRSRKRERLSPYDSIIKEKADSLGWDWRMLAAIIYQESRFHIEAQSHRGARGLMQMMPHTAKNYGVTDPLDPEENISAGANLLNSLLKRYSKVAASKEELFKYALAAYNAGVGRIDDIIRLAELRGVDTGHWESVIEVIPEMNDESVLDTGVVRLGVFKGKETINYVETVISVYEQFKRICPEQEKHTSSASQAEMP
ncbi:MAG TPA: hypothetical protein DHU72_04175 [Rikenellaceae bacterium]|nr:hypothetical protein [Rikenellaceae bacterium]